MITVSIREVLNRILSAVEDIDDFYFLSFKQEMLSSLFLYCMGLSNDEIMLVLQSPYLKSDALEDFLEFMKNRLDSDWVEIEKLHKFFIGLNEFIKDSIIAHYKCEIVIPESNEIKDKYFSFLNEN